MKFEKLLLIVIVCCCSIHIFSQERVDHRKMNYLINPKPNSILYNDTLYKGSNQYFQLFYRTKDEVLINLYLRHQSNKTWGNILGITGSFGTAIGILIATSSSSFNADRSAGWVIVGSGLACSIAGAYLIQSGQKNLAMAVELFNQKYNKANVGIGVSGNSAGFVVNF